MIILNKYKVTNIKRFRAFLFTSVLIGSMLIFLILSSFTQVFSSDSITFDSVKVEKGDTLWEIASEYSNGIRVDELVHKIKEINNISSANIHPGEILLIPIY